MLMSRGIPRLEPPENASQRQCASSFTTFFRPEQQSPSGFVKLLPCSTYVKQSARLSSADVQSTDGAGAGTSAPMTITIRLRRSKRDSVSVLAMTAVPIFRKYQLKESVVGFIGVRLFSLKRKFSKLWRFLENFEGLLVEGMMSGSVERKGTWIVGYGEKGFFLKRDDDLKECREICHALKPIRCLCGGKDCVKVCVWGKDGDSCQSSQAGYEGFILFHFWFFKPRH